MSPEARNEEAPARRGNLVKIVKDVANATPQHSSSKEPELNDEEYVYVTLTGESHLDIPAFNLTDNVIFTVNSTVGSSATPPRVAEAMRKIFIAGSSVDIKEWTRVFHNNTPRMTLLPPSGHTALFPVAFLINYERKIAELSHELSRYKASADTYWDDSESDVSPTKLSAASVQVLDYITSVRVSNAHDTLSDFEEEDS